MEIGFYLKKIISSLIMPLPIGIILLLIALFYFYSKDEKKVKIFFISGVVWLCVVSHSSFANFLLSPLENKFQKLGNIPNDVRYIVYLGGDQQNRGWEVLRLYNKIENVKIITSGYAGRGTIPEAIKTANILKDIGISSSDIMIHDKPKDTIEEAKKVKKLLKKEEFILVTSAYHMPRAMMLFQGEGLNPIAAPTDFLIKDSDKFLSAPSEYHLHKTKKAWHEYIGILWFLLKN